MQTIKSFKLLIIALVVCSNVFSQTNVYKPFPQVYGSWIVYKQGPLGPGLQSFSSWKKYIASGDTTIGSYTYKKVTVANNTGYPNFPNPVPFGPSTFAFAYRNDIVAKKVYYLDVTGGSNKDTLWYDFNINVGDTIKSAYSYFNAIGIPYVRVVQSIDSIFICGSYYKRFKVNCTDYESDLAEGVGFLDNFINTVRDNECPFEPPYLYSTTFSTCNITSIQDYVKENQINLFPNPASNELKISCSLQITEYTILNNFGAIILKEKLSDSQSIHISSLSNGLYIIKMRDKSGNNYQSKFIKQ